MRRIVLCEGPGDVAALREIALWVFHAEAQKRNAAAGAAGEEKRQLVRNGAALIELIAVANGKSGLGPTLVTTLKSLPPGNRPDDEAAVESVSVIFDPDTQSPGLFCAELSAAVAANASDWTLAGEPGTWVAHRAADEQVTIRAIHWRAPGAVVDGLPDTQTLERLLCFVAAQAYPEEALIVERWLGDLTTLGRKVGWKAALHLWCGLVEEKASETNAAAKFLHQNRTCAPLVRPIIEQVSLFNDLTPVLGPDQRAAGL
ncbi:MAG TPA: hypothetical protein VGQ83_03685 [Polyangia bacterium]|jgi:hypothetical protein